MNFGNVLKRKTVLIYQVKRFGGFDALLVVFTFPQALCLASAALKADLQLSPTLSLRLSLELIQAPKAHRHTNPPSRPRLFHRPVVQAPPTTSINKYAPPPKTRANSPIRCILPSTLDNITSLPADRHPSTRFFAHAPSCIRKLKTTSRSCETPSQKAYTVAGDAPLQHTAVFPDATASSIR